MALDISVADIRLSFLSISDAGANGVRLDADWLALDSNGDVITLINQQKDNEVRPFAEYPADVQAAIQTLNQYAIARIKTAKGIT